MAVVLKTTEMKVSQGSNPWLSVLTKMNAFLFSLRFALAVGLIALITLSVSCGLLIMLVGLGLLMLPYLGPGWTTLTLYGLLVATAFYVTKKHNRKIRPLQMKTLTFLIISGGLVAIGYSLFTLSIPMFIIYAIFLALLSALALLEANPYNRK